MKLAIPPASVIPSDGFFAMTKSLEEAGADTSVSVTSGISSAKPVGAGLQAQKQSIRTSIARKSRVFFIFITS